MGNDMRKQQRETGGPRRPQLLGGLAAAALVCAVVAVLLAAGDEAAAPAGGSKAAVEAAGVPRSPSPDFRRANWEVAPPEADPTAQESFFAERRKPAEAPVSLRHLEGVGVVFTAPEEEAR